MHDTSGPAKKLLLVCPTADVPDGQGLQVTIVDFVVAVFKVGDRYCVIDDHCNTDRGCCPRVRSTARSWSAISTMARSTFVRARWSLLPAWSRSARTTPRSAWAGSTSIATGLPNRDPRPSSGLSPSFVKCFPERGARMAGGR